MSEKIISTSDVSINTVAIEVKVMKIGNRQVTLAVFKQLPDEQIIDFDTGKLQGIPWGRVNYHPDCNKDMPNHFHIVWQKGNILCRAAIENRWDIPMLPEEVEYTDNPNPLSDMHYYAETYLFSRLLEGWLPDENSRRNRVSILIGSERFFYDLGEATTLFTDTVKTMRTYKKSVDSLEAWERRIEEARKEETDPNIAYYTRTLEEVRESHQKARQESQKARSAVIDLLKERDCPIVSNELFETRLLTAYQALVQFKQTWKQTCEQLEQLDQLFIAV